MSDYTLSQIRLAAMLAGVTVISGCGTGNVFQTDSDFDSRFYAGGGLLISQLEPETSGVQGVSVDDSDSEGLGLLLGYDFSNRFSVEGHIADLGDATFSPAGSISYQVAGLSGLFYAFGNEGSRQRREGFSGFGRLGIGTLDNDAEQVNFNQINSVHLLAGAGVEYGFSNGLAARAELVAHETDARYGQLALLYRFGGEPRRGRNSTFVDPVPEPDDLPAASTDSEGSAVDLSSVVTAAVADEPAPVAVPLDLDADADGVTDSVDECLNTEPGLPVNLEGCEVFNGAIEGINFLPNSADLTESAATILSEVAQTLRDSGDVAITIEAHTDSSGNAADNLQLSRRRALAVARFLVDEGIAGSRLKPQAFGESRPRQPNATAAGRVANRRVEFNIVR